MKKIPKEYYLELVVFLAHYHSGQWSRGYRLLSKLSPFSFSSNFEREAEQSDIYKYLVDNYKNKV